MKIFLLPIEPLQERYTDWWQYQIPQAFRSLGNDVDVINGEQLTATVTQGTVLDTIGTNYIKSTQIQRVCELFQQGKVKDGDVFFVCDIWFPGIEAIKYMSSLSGIKVKIFGIWHAGSITYEDFMTPQHQWAKYFELGFLNMCDGVFVGSDDSRESILNRLLPYVLQDEEAAYIAKKIHPYGLPMNFVQIDTIKEEKYPWILFPSRFDMEKRPNVFMDMIQSVIARDNFPKHKDIKFIFCTGREQIKTNEPWLLDKLKFMKETLDKNPHISLEFHYNLDKKAYYTLMAQCSAMVSCTVDETFGYCVTEACALGTIPIVPNDFCYPEILQSSKEMLGQDHSLGATEYMYNSFTELVEQVESNLRLWEDAESARVTLGQHKPVLRDFVEPYHAVVREWNDVIKRT